MTITVNVEPGLPVVLHGVGSGRGKAGEWREKFVGGEGCAGTMKKTQEGSITLTVVVKSSEDKTPKRLGMRSVSCSRRRHRRCRSAAMQQAGMHTDRFCVGYHHQVVP
ncbi:hypothetical protein E2C01_092954 [Portunus trituberculatus]|uniref:Uncharacterized protein n=1 Tax=Portunus trituberculatus TaxID=210409 RepID=A0A5B7JLN6_PORTR|nr:hypothetical protein [Portunus trituberculatus]